MQKQEQALKVVVYGFGCFYLVGVLSCGGCLMILQPTEEQRRETEQRKAYEKKFGSESMAYIMSQQFVEKELVTPATADFPLLDFKARHTGYGIWHVSGYVDSQDNFGETIRTNYSCAMAFEGNDRWSISDLLME